MDNKNLSVFPMGIKFRTQWLEAVSDEYYIKLKK